MRNSFWTGFGLGMLFSNTLLFVIEWRKKNIEMSVKNKSQKLNTNY
jgi:hypothetical protein